MERHHSNQFLLSKGTEVSPSKDKEGTSRASSLEDEQQEYLLDVEGVPPYRKRASRYGTLSGYAFPVSVLLLLLSSINLILALRHRPTDQQCVAQTSVWSPALEAVEFVEMDFENKFGHKSPYRGPPTEEIEAKWESLYLKHAVQIPADKLHFMNRTTEMNMMKVPKKGGTGYKAMLEVFHQLHCLNRIRQYTWLQSGNYAKDETDDGVPIPADLKSTEVGNRMHIDHCIETLRLTLMCHADITPLMIREDPKAPTGQSLDFNTHHKCRNFDKVSEWMDLNWATL